jgi:hypothetical protein
MPTLTDTGAAAALATAVGRCDWAALDAILPGLPPIAAMLAGAAGLLADVLTVAARDAGLPGDHIDLAAVWAGDWPAWHVAQLGLEPDQAGAALAWLGAWLDGDRWLPAHDQVACLAVAVTMAAGIWGERGGWPAFLLGREAAHE